MIATMEVDYSSLNLILRQADADTRRILEKFQNYCHLQLQLFFFSCSLFFQFFSFRQGMKRDIINKFISYLKVSKTNILE